MMKVIKNSLSWLKNFVFFFVVNSYYFVSSEGENLEEIHSRTSMFISLTILFNLFSILELFNETFHTEVRINRLYSIFIIIGIAFFVYKIIKKSNISDDIEANVKMANEKISEHFFIGYIVFSLVFFIFICSV